MNSKGIFCLEGNWWNDLKKGSSVEPVLQLLSRWDPYYVSYIHRDVGASEAFELYIKAWLQERHKEYSILYLAFHGTDGGFWIGDNRRSQNFVTWERLEELLEGRCAKRIIHIGCCLVMNEHGNRINRFLKRTGALAVSGYTSSVSWLESSAFEAILFGTMQLQALTVSGVRAVKRRVDWAAGNLANRLGFRMKIRER